MTTAELYAADLRNLINDLPVTFTHQGTDYVGTYGGITERKTLEIGGFQEEPELTLVVNLTNADGSNVFSTPPALGEKLTIDSRTYRIMRTEKDPAGIGLQMDLNTDTK